MPKRLPDPSSKERQAELKRSGALVPTLEHTYVCDEGHWITDSKTHETCIAYVKGAPCTGKLTRVGKPKTSARKKK